MADNADDVGDAIKEEEITRIQRETNRENEMFGVARRATPIDVRGSDPIGQAIKQREVSAIQRRTDLETQLFAPTSTTTAPATNGFGPTRPSMPSPEQLIDSAIQAKRDLIEGRQGDIRDRMAIRSTDQYGRRELKKDSAEYSALQHADATLQKDQWNRAHLKAGLAAHEFSLARETQIAGDVANYYRERSQIDSTLPHGSEEERQAIIRLGVKYPGVFKNTEASKDFYEHAQSHDNHAQFRQQAADQLGISVEEFDKQGYQAKSVTAGGTKGQQRVTFTKPDSEVQKTATKDLAKLGITPEEFQQHTNPRATTSSKFGNVTDIESKRKEDGQFVAFDVGNQKGVLVNRSDYERLKKVFPFADSGQPTANNFTDQKSFTDAFAKSKSGDVLYWQGKPYKKP